MSFNKKIYRKVLAAATALTMAFAVTSCGEGTAWVAKCQDTSINSGIYLFYQTEAMSEATSKLVKENSELDTKDTKLMKTLSIEGTDVTSWVNNKAEKQVKIFAGINKKFDELGLELTEDEKASAKSIADMYWQYYSEMYEQNGIGEDSFRQLVEFDTKKEKVFLHYYGEGGEKECDDAQLAAYLEGNYARVKTIKFDLTDSEGNALDNDAKAEVKKLAEEYKKKADEGKNFDDLIKEYADYQAKLAEEAAAEEAAEDEAAVTTGPAETESADVTAVSGDEASEKTEASTTAVTEEDGAEVTGDEEAETTTAVSDEENAEETTEASEASENEDAAVTTAAEESEEDAAVTTTAVTGDEAESEEAVSEDETEEETDPYANESIYKKGSEDAGYNPTEKVNNAVFNDCVVGGKATIVEDEENNSIYLIQRLDIVDREDLFEDTARTGYLEEMFKDEFENMAAEWADSYGYSVNAAAIKRYDPFKIKL